MKSFKFQQIIRILYLLKDLAISNAFLVDGSISMYVIQAHRHVTSISYLRAESLASKLQMKVNYEDHV